MFVVESFEMIIIVKKCSFKKHYEKSGIFSVTNGYENTRIKRLIFSFLQRWFKQLFLTSNQRKGCFTLICVMKFYFSKLKF